MKDKFFILRTNTIHEKKKHFKSTTFTLNATKYTTLLKTVLNIYTHGLC